MKSGRCSVLQADGSDRDPKKFRVVVGRLGGGRGGFKMEGRADTLNPTLSPSE